MSVSDNALRGQLTEKADLARYTTWKVGGPAERLYQPADLADLQQFLVQQPEQHPLTWLGLGSNSLIRDGGIAGTVILTLGALQKLTVEDDYLIRAEAGVSCASAARFSARRGWQDCEFLAGIPGTIGGALCMNAGCFGAETWQTVEKVETIDRQGHIHTRYPDEFNIAYRHAQGPADEWFVAGYFRLSPGDKVKSQAVIKTLLDRRAQTQPTNQPTCGSVFRNPEGDFAGRLVEACDLKGFELGGARVSPKHANFIENMGAATAKDIENLIEHMAEVVLATHRIALQREVHIIGEEK